MKLLDYFMMLNYKNGQPKYQCLHFYTMNIVHAIEYHPYHPHTRMLWWKRCSKCMLWCAMSELPHQPIFDRGDHFHLLQRNAARSATVVGPWWTVSDCCILQHRHRGCCPFVGGSRPKRSEFVSELPCFTLLEVHTSHRKRVHALSSAHMRIQSTETKPIIS